MRGLCVKKTSVVSDHTTTTGEGLHSFGEQAPALRMKNGMAQLLGMQKAPTWLAQFAQGMADPVVFFILLKLMYTCFKPFTIRLIDNRYRILTFRTCNSVLYNALRATEGYTIA